MIFILILLTILSITFSLLFFHKKNTLQKNKIAYNNVLTETEKELQKLKNINETLEMELQFVKDIYRKKLLKIGIQSQEEELV